MAPRKAANEALEEMRENLEAEAMAKPESAPEQAATVVPAAGVNRDAVVDALLAQVTQQARMLQQMQERLDVTKAPVNLGPPPLPRNKRPHIMVAVTPDTEVRIEVPQSYIDERRIGWDGRAVRGYLNHDNSRLSRR